MEVSAIMMFPAQLSQGLNGTVPGDETGRALSAPFLPERFSQLLDQQAGKGEVPFGGADPSANPMFLNAFVSSMRQQEPGMGFLQTEGKIVFMDPAIKGAEEKPETVAQPEKDEEADAGFPKEEFPEAAAKPPLTAFQWNPAFDVIPSMVVNIAKTMPGIAAGQSCRDEQTAITAITGESQAGSPVGVQLAGPADQNKQQALPQPVDGQVLKQGSESLVQEQGSESLARTGALPMQKGASGEIDGQELFRSRSGNMAINGKAEVLAVSNTVMPLPDNSEVSASMNKPASTINSSSSSEKSPNIPLRQGDVVSIDGGDEIGLKGENRFDAMTIPRPERVSEPPARPVSTITGETGKEVKDAAVAYRASDGKTATPAGNNPIAPAAGVQQSDNASMTNPVIGIDVLNNTGGMPKQLLKESGEGKRFGITSDKAEAKPEQNGANLFVKAGLNSAEPSHGRQRIETPFAEGVKSLLKEAGMDAPGKSGEEKSASMDSPGITIHGTGETRVNGENRLTIPANSEKLPFGEQIRHQVREKLESGDYGINKGSITLKLHPEDLGELKINMRMEDQRLKVEIVTENRSVKEALMQNLDSLKETLSRQNITMDRFNVTADLRQGFQQGSRDGSRMMQDNRGTGGAPFNGAVAVDETPAQSMPYGWENDNSLVSLIL